MLPKQQAGILDAEIPLGGFGRPLTAEERSKLLRAGIPCSERHIVMRAAVKAVNTRRLGRLYEPTYTAGRHAPMELFLS